MSGQVCEVCGKKLTKWNHAWGTNKCSHCAKGRSPEAKREKDFELLDRRQFQSKEDISKCKMISAMVKSLALLLVVNAVAELGHIMARTTKNDQFFLIEILAFVGGIWVGNDAYVFGGANLLDFRRWRRFWHGDLLGYTIGQIFSVLPTTFLMAKEKASKQTSSPNEIGFALLFMLAFPPLCGLLLGAFNMWRADKKETAYTIERYEEWQMVRKTNEATP